LDACLTLYHWLKQNRNYFYTDPKNFLENGGTVPKRPRRIYQAIHSQNLSFEEYLDFVYKIIPYDALLSENSKYITHIIRFEKIQDDFKACFEGLGLKIDRELPVYNKTDNKTTGVRVDSVRLTKIFGPYLNYNHRLYKDSECIVQYNLGDLRVLDIIK